MDNDMEEAKVISPDDLTQYHAAADIANRVILRLVTECVVGRKVVDLCVAGDKLVAEEVCGEAGFRRGRANLNALIAKSPLHLWQWKS